LEEESPSNGLFSFLSPLISESSSSPHSNPTRLSNNSDQYATKKLQTTQRYMHLINYGEEENTVAGATTAKEATQLIEKSFQYVTTIEGIQLFKKRK
jgi:hypothetical protein